MGKAIAAAGMGLVYGGASVGLMGWVADAVLADGGEVVGVIPKSMSKKEIAHGGLTDLHVVESMHERKAKMADLSSAFIALPGGLGTLEELLEILTWAQLGMHKKPIGVLNVGRYYDPLLALLDHAVDEQFVRPEHRLLLLSATTPEQLLAGFEQYRPATGEKWITEEQT
jgi:uncharacterized protein (TIGR00730 family)